MYGNITISQQSRNQPLDSKSAATGQQPNPRLFVIAPLEKSVNTIKQGRCCAGKTRQERLNRIEHSPGYRHRNGISANAVTHRMSSVSIVLAHRTKHVHNSAVCDGPT